MVKVLIFNNINKLNILYSKINKSKQKKALKIVHKSLHTAEKEIQKTLEKRKIIIIFFIPLGVSISLGRGSWGTLIHGAHRYIQCCLKTNRSRPPKHAHNTTSLSTNIHT